MSGFVSLVFLGFLVLQMQVFRDVYAGTNSCIAENTVKISYYQTLNCPGDYSLTPQFNTSSQPPVNGNFSFVAPKNFSRGPDADGYYNCQIYVKINDSVRGCDLTPSANVLSPGQLTSVKFVYQDSCNDKGDCQTTVKVRAPAGSTATATAPVASSYPTPVDPSPVIPTSTPRSTKTPTPAPSSTKSSLTTPVSYQTPPYASPSVASSPVAEVTNPSGTTTTSVIPTAYDEPVSISPEIINPQPQSTLSGIRNIEVKAKAGSNVDLYLQTTTGVIGTLLLSRISVSAGFQNAVYGWDTANTPNGTYELYAIVLAEGESQVIVGPVVVSVNNPVSGQIELPPVVASPVATSGASLKPAPTFVGTTQKIATSGAILFPSEFKPEEIEEDHKVRITTVENAKVDGEVVLSFKGYSVPNTIITLIIYSNPIVVTVKTDENGLWTYNLTKPLEPGNHTAYAIVPQFGEAAIRSQAVEFIISASFAASSNDESLVLATTNQQSIKPFIIATVLIVLSGVVSLIFILKFKKNGLESYGNTA